MSRPWVMAFFVTMLVVTASVILGIIGSIVTGVGSRKLRLSAGLSLIILIPASAFATMWQAELLQTSFGSQTSSGITSSAPGPVASQGQVNSDGGARPEGVQPKCPAEVAGIIGETYSKDSDPAQWRYSPGVWEYGPAARRPIVDFTVPQAMTAEVNDNPVPVRGGMHVSNVVHAKVHCVP